MSAYARVDLPEPFGPMIACTSFVSTSRSTPLTISVPSSRATWRFSSFSKAMPPGYRDALPCLALMGLTQPTHIAILLGIILLLFGAKRLPEMGRALGSGMPESKAAIPGHTPAPPPAELPPADPAPSEHNTPV